MSRFTAIFLSISLLLIGFQSLQAQKPQKWNSSEIHSAIQKLNVLGSALYIAAHPDDENTRMIAYLANEKKLNVAYLSLTRGDGGQNLVGPEIRELLGLIRTQELLAARRTDGGHQMFSRANDFGYSKHPDETLKIWNKDAVLSDVVWAIRKWQPDIIINRFDHESAGRTHGHHTSSAMLSFEAFDLTNKRDVYPEQLAHVAPWQPRRLFFNTSWWFYGSQENFKKADKSKMLGVDVGVYFPKLGKSNTEIAALSRSMHKSQGFGSTGSRGREIEYLKLLKGDMPTDKTDPLQGLDLTWGRVDGGAPIGALLTNVAEKFDFDAPYLSVPDLIKAYDMIQALPEGYWKRVKSAEIRKVIKACAGLYLEAVASDYSATPGQEIEVDLEFINRSPLDITLEKFHLLPEGLDTTVNAQLLDNEIVAFSKKLTIPANTPYSSAYWLKEASELGMYNVSDQLMRGLPESPRPAHASVTLAIEGKSITYLVDVVHKRNDPVDGEVYRPFEVIPPVSASIQDKVYLFADEAPKLVKVKVKSGQPDVTANVKLNVPNGWTYQPTNIPVDLKIKGAETVISFELTPPAIQTEGHIEAVIDFENKSYNQEVMVIDYDHIPTQTVLLEAKAKAVKVDLKRVGQSIGYIPGAGDAIPESLEQVGFDVTLLGDDDMSLENFKRYDAIIMGIRAYNTNDRIKFYQDDLMKYVEEGGTMIVQYNTTRRLKIPSDQIGPYPFKLSRDRTTVEEAEVRMLKSDHPVLNYPNKITAADFEGWVQERGLYFPNEWDDQYDAILSSNDPGEEPHDGGLLVAKYGQGHYVYSGYSWFRELPAGVPGAYRLFVNLIALGNDDKP